MKKIMILAATAGLVASGAYSQGEMTAAERAHQIRLAHMSLFAHNIGPLAAMAKGEMEYDADVAARNADNIAKLASVDTTSYWVEGSDSESLADSRALPAIWESPDDFYPHFDTLQEAATAAAQAAPEGQQAFAAAVGDLGKACGGCHEDYRKPKD